MAQGFLNSEAEGLAKGIWRPWLPWPSHRQQELQGIQAALLRGSEDTLSYLCPLLGSLPGTQRSGVCVHQDPAPHWLSLSGPVLARDIRGTCCLGPVAWTLRSLPVQ